MTQAVRAAVPDPHYAGQPAGAFNLYLLSLDSTEPHATDLAATMEQQPGMASPTLNDNETEYVPAAVPPRVERDLLYQDFQPLVRRLIRQYGGDDAELRQDLAGEIYFRFSALLDAYDPSRGVPLRPYLVRQLTASVYTYARQQWRSRKREVSLELRVEEGGDGAVMAGGSGGAGGAALRTSQAASGGLAALASDPTPAWDDAIVRDELLRCLPHLIAKLPQRQRRVLVWRYFEQRSFEEIAEQLQVKPATARSLLRYALLNLRKGLAG